MSCNFCSFLSIYPWTFAFIRLKTILSPTRSELKIYMLGVYLFRYFLIWLLLFCIFNFLEKFFCLILILDTCIFRFFCDKFFPVELDENLFLLFLFFFYGLNHLLSSFFSVFFILPNILFNLIPISGFVENVGLNIFCLLV